MRSHAIAKYVRISPFQARKVVDMVRGRNVGEAISILTYTQKKAAAMVAKVIQSAVANVDQVGGNADLDALYIHSIMVDEGPTQKRFRPRAMGRATRILKRTSHITVVVDDGEES